MQAAQALHEFERYIAVNMPFIPNYEDRYRNGEAMATGLVKSTINQVVSTRFVKQQSMWWMECGVHLLLQVQARTLKDELRSAFEGWYPGLLSAVPALADGQREAALPPVWNSLRLIELAFSKPYSSRNMKACSTAIHWQIRRFVDPVKHCSCS